MSWDPSSLPRGGGKVVLHDHGAWCEVVLEHPARRNALTPGMMTDLLAVITRLEQCTESVGVILRGAGTAAFCAGGDLEAVQTSLARPGAGEGMCATMQAGLDRLAGLPMVVVAAVEGAALGGGAELLTCCDRVYAGTTATIGFVHAALGVSPGWGGGHRLVARLGQRAALRVLVEAKRMDAVQAAAAGLVDEVVPAGSAMGAAQAWVKSLAAHPVAAVRGAVQVARAQDPDEERQVFTSLWGGADHTAAVSAALAAIKAARSPTS